MFASVESHWPRNRHGERYVLGKKGEESVVLETSARGDGKAFIDWLTVTFPVAAIDANNDWNVPECAGQVFSDTPIGCLIADCCSKALGGKLPSFECRRTLL